MYKIQLLDVKKGKKILRNLDFKKKGGGGEGQFYKYQNSCRKICFKMENFCSKEALKLVN